MSEIVFATNNAHKLHEVQNMVPPQFKLLSLDDVKIDEDIPEEQATLEGNAIQKARYIYDKLNINVFADDTGLEIEALNGEPGVYSARYAGEEKSAQNNMQLVLDKLDGKENRKAQFRTVICLIYKNKEHLFEGIVKGEMLSKKTGNEGFGYDPIFKPDGYDCSFAEMPLSEKNTISHRSRAIKKLINFLNTQ